MAFGHTWIINPKLVNEVTLSNTQMDFRISGQAIMSNGKPFCWSNFISVGDPAGPCSTEGFTIAGSDSYFYGPYVEPCSNNHGNNGLFDNFSAEEGRHNLSFGINHGAPVDVPGLRLSRAGDHRFQRTIYELRIGGLPAWRHGTAVTRSRRLRDLYRLAAWLIRRRPVSIPAKS